MTFDNKYGQKTRQKTSIKIKGIKYQDTGYRL